MYTKQDHRLITLQPSIRQYVIDHLPVFVVLTLLFVAGGFPGFSFHGTTLEPSSFRCLTDDETFALQGIRLLFALACSFLSLYLLYRFIYMRRITYHIGTEQIVCEHGVFQRSVNYMEMYRIVDFAERQSFMQQLLGVKTITILSMDRSTPKLDMTGIPHREAIVQVIRHLAEENKRNKGIYEITNR